MEYWFRRAFFKPAADRLQGRGPVAEVAHQSTIPSQVAEVIPGVTICHLMPRLAVLHCISLYRTKREQRCLPAALGRGEDTMARYRFHATNGSACVFDAIGRSVRNPERLQRWAAEVA